MVCLVNHNTTSKDGLVSSHDVSDQDEDVEDVEGAVDGAVGVEELDPDARPGELPVEVLLFLELLDGGVHGGDEQVEQDDHSQHLINVCQHMKSTKEKKDIIAW